MQSFQEMMDYIRPEQVGRYWFRGLSPQTQGRVFGGQVVAQCLLAAYATVDETFTAHSLHAYFLRGGDPKQPIEFEVDPIRDGSSFCTRRVVARQNGQAIFNTSVSYQVQEQGFEHSEPMPKLQPPVAKPLSDINRDIEGDKELNPRQRNMFQIFQVQRERANIKQDPDSTLVRAHWFCTRGPLEDDPRLHQAALALISDFSLLGTCIQKQGLEDWEDDLMIASLDHAIWFHRPVNINDYVLYGSDSPWAGNSRGFNRGSFWNTSGELIASTIQESLVRKKRR